MRTHRTPGLVALTAVTALLLTGCGADDPAASKASDGSAHRSDVLPAPDAPATEVDGDETAPDHLSTFALDVDTASYGYARRTLDEGELPDAPSLTELAARAHDLADRTEDRDVRGLAEAIDRADRIGDLDRGR
uniref:VWA domain-containing protein n=1 Tax=Streptomyces sp. SS7 TaxID=3108485 RepID=UPI0040400986